MRKSKLAEYQFIDFFRHTAAGVDATQASL